MQWYRKSLSRITTIPLTASLTASPVATRALIGALVLASLSSPALAQSITGLGEIRNLTSTELWGSITIVAGLVAIGFAAFAIFRRDASYFTVPIILATIFWVGPEILDLALTEGQGAAGAFAPGAAAP